jgi:hypothetical protein
VILTRIDLYYQFKTNIRGEIMAQVFGNGSFTYEHVEGWPHIPVDITLLECLGVGIDF